MTLCIFDPLHPLGGDNSREYNSTYKLKYDAVLNKHCLKGWKKTYDGIYIIYSFVRLDLFIVLGQHYLTLTTDQMPKPNCKFSSIQI